MFNSAAQLYEQAPALLWVITLFSAIIWCALCSHPLDVPLRSWQQTFRSHRPLSAGNLLPFGLNSITLCVPYSIHKQEVRTLLPREDVVEVFISQPVNSCFTFHLQNIKKSAGLLCSFSRFT